MVCVAQAGVSYEQTTQLHPFGNIFQVRYLRINLACDFLFDFFLF